MAIEIRNVEKTFGAFTALGGVSLDVRSGELLALLGPSGSGKTTLLRIIAGLDHADAGEVSFDGQDTRDRAARDRKVGFVFQHYALFRHMTVFDNVAFGLRVKKKAERPAEMDIRRRVGQLLEMVQLSHLASRYPSQLSGGQRQRVALARALAIEPKVLLLDEPFGALDAKVRKDLRKWLRHLHDDMHITSIFVTHDQEEALELADRVVVMNHGQIIQVGTPAEVYDTPADSFVFDFLGGVNRLNGVIEGGVARLDGKAVRVDGEVGPNGPAVIYVRPHQVELDVAPGDGVPEGKWSARVSSLHAAGPVARLELDLAGRALEAQLSRDRLSDLALDVGSWCTVDFRHARVFPAKN
ncbi:sulfate/molybdate ABC transporter ATP-binding protein [Nitrospirillum pindoramense]|uniref:Sulfate transport system ATP-binding protein n=1 Tax=Nitrospirillum amazonense TaxID=28077 RepID=A0A560GP98_9PROT|nr:sulfate ABC transporter ATP-binding protein [Nitrospirillum amazonense]TWB35827.1 sulfate transport system ATP-binding protein [Nitrospirillum amazonense]